MHDARHLNWGADTLWRQLDPLLPGISVEVVARTDSTNTQLLDRARVLGGRRDAPITRPGEFDARAGGGETTPHGRRNGDTQPCLLVAEHQTRGRGRLGRDWMAAPGNSLTFSLALPYAPRDWSGLSLAVGVALAETLDPPAPGASPRLGLKWPNDLWLLGGPDVGRKLGGILIETVPIGEQRMCVIGIGLNVLPMPAQNLSHTATPACRRSMRRRRHRARWRQVAAPLVRALKRFEAEGFAAFAAAYRARDLLIGQAVTTTAADCPQGIADGVDVDGALRVRPTADPERIQRLVSGEISVRLRGADTESLDD